jgi:hypothetical protein
MMARRVIRRTTDLDNRVGWKPARWTMDRSRWREVPAYRIEWPDGTPTGTGLFASQGAAEQYALGHGWMFDVEHEEECA